MRFGGSARERVKAAGVLVGERSASNYVAGANVQITIVDDAANDELDITIATTGLAASAHTHSHDSELTDVSANDHHNQAHTDTDHSDGANVKSALADAKGDIIAATDADTWARKAVGAAGYVLGTDSQSSDGLGWLIPWWIYDAPTGSVAQNLPRAVAGGANNATLTSQVPFLTAIFLASGVTVTSIAFTSGSTGAGTPAHQIFGLYDSSRALLRATADDTSTAWASNTTKTLNLTATYTTTAAGLYYVAILVDAATVPTLRGTAITSTNHNARAPVLNGNTSDTGLTALPNPAGAITAATTIPYTNLL